MFTDPIESICQNEKIAFFMPSFGGGGAERAMLNVAGGLVRRGYRVDILAIKAVGPLMEIFPKGARLVDLHKPRMLAALPGLVAYLRRERPKALYSTIAHSNIVALLAGWVAGVGTRIVVRESNVPMTEPKRTWARWAVHKLTPHVYPLASAILAVSDGVAAELGAMNPRMRAKIIIPAQPVVSDEMFAQAAEPVPHPWFSDDSVPVILGVGRLQPVKNFGLLMRAFSQVRRERNARLVILGEGILRPELEALARELGITEDFALPGFVLNPFAYIKRAQVFVLASLFEGMPNVLLQAMALGTPVISTDCPSGPRECLEGGRLGKLIPMNDQDALAKAILHSLDLPRQHETAERISQQYGVDRAVTEYLRAAGCLSPASAAFLHPVKKGLACPPPD